METMRLLVTELVTNSVGTPAAELGAQVLGRQSAVSMEVTDEGPGFHAAAATGIRRADSGWGLFLVERLADRWGVKDDGPRKRVWFELRRA